MGEQLAGGNMNAVERIGDTVHRAAGPWTPTVHRLLEHVRAAGVEWIPEPLGTDERGREVLSYLAGEVPLYPLPDWVWADSVLTDAASRLRIWHDATEDFPRADAVWQLPSHGADEVICHNDFAPHNLVFSSGEIIGVIDFDTASPGNRLWDLAYLATRIVPLDRASEGPDAAGTGEAAIAAPDAAPIGLPGGAAMRDERVRRIHMLLEAYGSGEPVGALIDTAIERLEDLAVFSERKAVELGKPELDEHAAGYRLDAASLRRQFADTV
ncbi:aminoglycoside phosphotransferase family protein [Plantibacter sp. YIM 135249]|uniref:aminoglycoside phosphotransferase family protein n=1 Tax=Plantibacter sp. YIM 135249 TaxID=3423918 RepID=UPI003D34703A